MKQVKDKKKYFSRFWANCILIENIINSLYKNYTSQESCEIIDCYDCSTKDICFCISHFDTDFIKFKVRAKHIIDNYE